MRLDELARLLDAAPAVLVSEPLSAAFLSSVEIMKGQDEFIRMMDGLRPQQSARTLLLGGGTHHTERFRHVVLEHNPYGPELGKPLFEKYGEIMRWAFTQRNVAGEILSDTRVDVIVLMLIDGLSYEDCKHRPLVRPCLVNGATITSVGFRNIVGDPPIAYRLSKMGFKSRLGISYWDRSNELTDALFRCFDAQAQIVRVEEFDQITARLTSQLLPKTYVQIVLSGLDQVAHYNRGRPAVKQLVDRIFDDYVPALASVLKNQRLRGLIYLVADHGIWWRPAPGAPPAVVVPDDAATRKRLLVGSRIRNNVLHVSCHGQAYSLLSYPYVFRAFKRTEWGTHGGVSYYESVVPFMKLEVY